MSAHPRSGTRPTDDSTVDTLSRACAVPSRRAALRLLVGALLGSLGPLAVSESEAHNPRKRCKKRQDKAKRRRCAKKAKQHTAAHCPPSCAGKVCGDDGCGGSCGTCAAGDICAQSQCVTGQGSCPAGADICTSAPASCGSGCHCFLTTALQTRCAEPLSGADCGQCTSDAECETLFPTVPGVFCAKDTGDDCPCVPGEGFCRQPCVNPT